MNSSDRERDLALANYSDLNSNNRPRILFGIGRGKYVPYLPTNVRDITLEFVCDDSEKHMPEGIDFRVSFGFGFEGGRKIYCEREEPLN